MSDKVDQLSLDAAQARKKGMTYGKYMQWKYTHKGEPAPIVKTTVGPGEAICKKCGKIFVRSQHYRTYCSRICRSYAMAENSNHRR